MGLPQNLHYFVSAELVVDCHQAPAVLACQWPCFLAILPLPRRRANGSLPFFIVILLALRGVLFGFIVIFLAFMEIIFAFMAALIIELTHDAIG